MVVCWTGSWYANRKIIMLQWIKRLKCRQRLWLSKKALWLKWLRWLMWLKMEGMLRQLLMITRQFLRIFQISWNKMHNLHKTKQTWQIQNKSNHKLTWHYKCHNQIHNSNKLTKQSPNVKTPIRQSPPSHHIHKRQPINKPRQNL